MDYQLIDDTWFILIIIMLVLWFIRKSIIKANGYTSEITYSPRERKQMNEIIEEMADDKKRLLYKSINFGLPFTFFMAFLLLITARVIEFG